MRIIGFIQIALGLILCLVSFFFLFLMWSDEPVSHNIYEYLPGLIGVISIILGIINLVKKKEK
jgi:hypothetical protein